MLVRKRVSAKSPVQENCMQKSAGRSPSKGRLYPHKIIGIFLITLLFQPTVTAEEKSLAEWQSYVQEQVRQPQKRSLEFESIQIGAAYCTGDYQRFIRKHTFESKHATLQPHIQKYKEFIKGPGKAMLDKWLAGEALTEEEKPYRFILEATRCEVLHERGKKEYRTWAKEVTHEVTRLMGKAYTQKKLSNEDMDKLRLAALGIKLQGAANREYCPFYIFRDRKTNLPPRSILSNKEAAILSSVLAHPNYTDLPRPFPMIEPFTWEGMLEYVLVLNSYHVTTNTDGAVKWEYIEKQDTRFQFEKLFAHDRPTLVLFEHPRDSWSSKWSLPALEALYMAYGDKIDIKIVAVNYGDNCPPTHNYFVPVKDRLAPQQREYHAYSYKNMARMCKEHYMNFPHMKVPFLLDSPGRILQDSFKSIGGQTCGVLVDKNHKLVMAFGTPTYRKIPRIYHLENLPFQASMVIHMWNHVEQEIREVLANKGDVVPGRPNPGLRFQGLENYLIPKSMEEAIRQRGSRAWVHMRGHVTHIDIGKEQITIKGKKEKIFNIVDGCRISVDGKEAALNAITVGDKVGITYMLKNQFGNDRTLIITGLWKGEPSYPGGKDTDIWFCGKIKAIDSDNKILTLFMKKQDPLEYPGYQFWKEAGETAYIEGDNAMQSLPIVTQWIMGDDLARTFRFKMDAAVGTFLNGKETKFSELKIGDFAGISISYKCIDRLNQTLNPEYVRATRF